MTLKWQLPCFLTHFVIMCVYIYMLKCTSFSQGHTAKDGLCIVYYFKQSLYLDWDKGPVLDAFNTFWSSNDFEFNKLETNDCQHRTCLCSSHTKRACEFSMFELRDFTISTRCMTPSGPDFSSSTVHTVSQSLTFRECQAEVIRGLGRVSLVIDCAFEERWRAARALRVHSVVLLC